MSQLKEPPDLELGPISIWVLGRARDPEWLNLGISVDTGSSSVRTEGDGLRSIDLAVFVDQLEKLYSTLKLPAVVLDASDIGVVLTIAPRSLGHILATLDISGGAQSHRFEVKCDQTDVGRLLSQSRVLSKRFPSTVSEGSPKLSLPRPTGPVPNVADLAGLELTIARLAADIRVFGFGPVRPHPNGKGTVATYALHLQCAWRITQEDRLLTGDGDLWSFVGPGEAPEGWNPWEGGSLQSAQLDEMLGPRLGIESAFYYSSGISVDWAHADPRRGDVAIVMSSGHVLSVFPNRREGEHWRLFKPGRDEEHYVFETGQLPRTADDVADGDRR